MFVSIDVITSLPLTLHLPSVTWLVGKQMALWDRFQSVASYRASAVLCHLTGMASVLIRGSMDATLHLPTVTQPGGTDADEVDAIKQKAGNFSSFFLSSPVVQQDLLRGEKQHLKVCEKRIKVGKQQPDGFGS